MSSNVALNAVEEDKKAVAQASAPPTRKVHIPRISRSSQLIIILGVLVIACATFVLVQGQQQARQSVMTTDITRAANVLSKPLPQPAADLQSKIQTAQADLKTAQAMFPKSADSLAITDTLFGLAAKSGVEVISANSSVSKKTLKDIEYSVVSETLSLKGPVSSILVFLANLGKELPSSEIVAVNLVKAQSLKEKDSGSVTINVYTSK